MVESTRLRLFLVREEPLRASACLATLQNRDANQIAGDGIGAEVAESVKTIFKADNVPIEWEQVDVSGVDTGVKHREELFRESIASLKRNKIGLKGVSKPSGTWNWMLMESRYPTYTH